MLLIFVLPLFYVIFYFYNNYIIINDVICNMYKKEPFYKALLL